MSGKSETFDLRNAHSRFQSQDCQVRRVRTEETIGKAGGGRAARMQEKGKQRERLVETMQSNVDGQPKKTEKDMDKSEKKAV